MENKNRENKERQMKVENPVDWKKRKDRNGCGCVLVLLLLAFVAGFFAHPASMLLYERIREKKQEENWLQKGRARFTGETNTHTLFCKRCGNHWRALKTQMDCEDCNEEAFIQ